jgi:hypothetical protein
MAHQTKESRKKKTKKPPVDFPQSCVTREQQHPFPKAQNTIPEKRQGHQETSIISANTWIRHKRNKSRTFAELTILFVVAVVFFFLFFPMFFLFS